MTILFSIILPDYTALISEHALLMHHCSIIDTISSFFYLDLIITPEYHDSNGTIPC